MEVTSKYSELVVKLAKLRKIEFNYTVDINRYIPGVGKLVDATTLPQVVESTKALLGMIENSEALSYLGISSSSIKPKTKSSSSDELISSPTKNSTIDVELYLAAYKMRAKEIQVKDGIKILKEALKLLAPLVDKSELLKEREMEVEELLSDIDVNYEIDTIDEIELA